MNTVIEEIRDERERQINQEGWTLENDDTHLNGELAGAAAVYASSAVRFSHTRGWIKAAVLDLLWPWSWDWFKPKDQRRDLIRAAALIVAEIERLDRAKASQPPPEKGKEG